MLGRVSGHQQELGSAPEEQLNSRLERPENPAPEPLLQAVERRGAVEQRAV